MLTKYEQENKYMEEYWSKLRAEIKKKSLPCIFRCGNLSVPGGEICVRCDKAFSFFVKREFLRTFKEKMAKGGKYPSYGNRRKQIQNRRSNLVRRPE